jgi:hypothetical protein
MNDAAILLLLWILPKGALAFCWFEKLRRGAGNGDRFAWRKEFIYAKFKLQIEKRALICASCICENREKIVNSRFWSHCESLCSRSVHFCSEPVPLSALSVVDCQVVTLRLAAYCRESWYGDWLPLKFRHGRDCPDALLCFPHALQYN